MSLFGRKHSGQQPENITPKKETSSGYYNGTAQPQVHTKSFSFGRDDDAFSTINEWLRSQYIHVENFNPDFGVKTRTEGNREIRREAFLDKCEIKYKLPNESDDCHYYEAAGYAPMINGTDENIRIYEEGIGDSYWNRHMVMRMTIIGYVTRSKDGVKMPVLFTLAHEREDS